MEASPDRGSRLDARPRSAGRAPADRRAPRRWRSGVSRPTRTRPPTTPPPRRSASPPTASTPRKAPRSRPVFPGRCSRRSSTTRPGPESGWATRPEPARRRRAHKASRSIPTAVRSAVTAAVLPGGRGIQRLRIRQPPRVRHRPAAPLQPSCAVCSVRLNRPLRHRREHARRPREDPGNEHPVVIDMGGPADPGQPGQAAVMGQPAVRRGGDGHRRRAQQLHRPDRPQRPDRAGRLPQGTLRTAHRGQQPDLGSQRFRASPGLVPRLRPEWNGHLGRQLHLWRPGRCRAADSVAFQWVLHPRC